MKRRLLAALTGVGAGVLLLGAYFAVRYSGIELRPDLVVAAGAAFVFAGAVALFALVAMDRPAFRSARAALLLNEDPAKEYVFPFRGADTLAIVARPEMSVGEMLVRFGDAFEAPPDKMTKSIVVTIKGSAKKPFASMTLQRLFAMLKPYNLEHVLLTSEKDEFIGYIPGKRAAKEFSGDKAVEAIDKYIVRVVAKPDDCAILRELGGATRDDTIAESENAFQAQAKLWADEKIQGLVLYKHLKPVGYISKVDILRLNAGLQ
ncbi:MAG TPA: hypothetical protein VGC36_05245 [Rhizomicrobium sp.]